MCGHPSKRHADSFFLNAIIENSSAYAQGCCGAVEVPMAVKYQGTVREVGALAADMQAAGVLVLFGMTAPAELREISVVHEGAAPSAPLAAGDSLTLGDTQYIISCFGSMANGNFAELGHIVIKANGATETELPGEVSVNDTPLVLPRVGDALIIRSAS
jgi:glucitol/sorbitol PTS system EIIA component